MTQEEKAKAYDEALLRADEAVQKGCLDKDMFDIIFPPGESEDEKIRKDLIHDIQMLPNLGVLTHRPVSEYIAYLEKQEQKHPVDVDPCDASWDAYYQRGLNKGYELGLEAGRKEQKPELVQHPPITFTYNSNASRDERLKAALLALLNSDLLKVKEGGYFTKQDLIDWVERIPTDKPAEWKPSEEQEVRSARK